MKVTLRKSADSQTAYALHLLTFPDDTWEDESFENTYWVATDENSSPVGFCAARRSIGAPSWVFLSRAGILPCARGLHLQRRMIRARVQWARSIGADGVLTYVHMDNHESLVNLLKCGFRLYIPNQRYAGREFLYLYKRFNDAE